MTTPARIGSAPCARRSRLRGEESGFTLTELLVAMTMLVGVMAGATSLLVGTMQSQPELTDRARQLQEARVAAERMVRELRQGYSIDSATGTVSSVTFRTYMRRTCQGGASTTANLCRVTYTCTPATRICTRSTANANGTSPTAAVQILKGPSNADVFSVQPTYVGIKFVIPAKDGRGATTLEEGATLRNATLGL